MAKAKITKSKIPFLKRDLEIDDEVLKKLSIEQERYRTQLKTRLEEVKAESLKRYKAKIESLSSAKTKVVKDFDEDLKKYKALAKDLEGTETKGPTKKASPSKGKTSNKPKN